MTTSTWRIDHVRLLTAVAGDGAAPHARCSNQELGLLDDASLVVADDRIVWVGPQAAAPAVDRVVAGGGRLLTPALIDCHTHLPFGGDRAFEYALRARGANYQAIAQAGGGIAATVRATRALTDDALTALICARAHAIAATGVRVIEVKTGYELTLAGELRTLRAIAQAQRTLGAAITLVPTLLAHIVPPECTDAAQRAAWVTQFATQLIPQVAAAKLATSVDVYCDQGAFTRAETVQLWQAAQQHGLGVRGHLGQFADFGAAADLAAMGGMSADHLEVVSRADAAALAAAGTIAVMIPTACVQLRQAPPDVAMMRAAGLRFAVASDMNPGTSFATGLGTAMWLATSHYGMTIEETWLGVTHHAACAVGRPALGQVRIGGAARVLLWDTDEPAAIPYRMGTIAHHAPLATAHD